MEDEVTKSHPIISHNYLHRTCNSGTFNLIPDCLEEGGYALEAVVDFNVSVHRNCVISEEACVGRDDECMTAKADEDLCPSFPMDTTIHA